MQQFSVDIFDRKLKFVCNGQTAVTEIDDDYISSTANVIDISNVPEEIKAGYFIRLQSEKTEFFGLITDVSPGEYVTTIQFESFISIFNETILFYMNWQGTEAGHSSSLENAIRTFISTNYITNEDTLMRLPISVAIDPNITQLMRWTVGIERAKDGVNFATPNLYTDLIIPALKLYGVSIVVTPDFNEKLINLKITKSTKTLNIDGDLDDVFIRTIKYNNRPLGTNKLLIVNSIHPTTKQITYYVHPNRSFDTNNTNRITPVNFETRIVTPSEDTDEEFQATALEEAYNAFSGNAWDNLIEIEVAPDNQNIKPMELEIGQKISLWYKNASYTSILTGKIISSSYVVLLFGSERIQYTKRNKRYTKR